jgi:p-cumate 2,3-dioxygenase beta subunit
MSPFTAEQQLTRAEVEDLLYHEADLLDQWRLDEWLELLTEDFRYVVPPTDVMDADPTQDLVLVDDDISRVRARVKRLNSRRAHREFPWSRTRRLITNVRLVDQHDDEVTVTANFIVYRLRNGDVNPYIGRYIYRLVRQGDSLKIRFRRAEMDLESLRPHGTVSIIL